jgi:hypothetical protein
LATVDTSRRIYLITESARLASGMKMVDLDLILDQYGIKMLYRGRYGDEDDDGLYTYAVHRLQEASDSNLEAVHAYLTRDSADVPTGDDPGVWTPGQLRLFVSHLSAHKEFVGAVSGYLAQDGVTGFVAHTSIQPSKEWEDVIEAALRTCDAMLVLLHEGFHASKWCDQEVGFGLARKIPTLPVIIEEMPYGFMSKYQAVQGRGVNAFQLAAKISDWLVSTPTTQPAMTESLVTALERSFSYDRTRRVVTLLRLLPRFTSEQLHRLREAAHNNDQVNQANLRVNRDFIQVPELIEDLIAQHGAPVPAALASEEAPF